MIVMSAAGITPPVPATTVTERCGSHTDASRSQFNFRDAGHTTIAGYASSASSAARPPPSCRAPARRPGTSAAPAARTPRRRAGTAAAHPRAPPRRPAPRPRPRASAARPRSPRRAPAQAVQHLARGRGDLHAVRAQVVLEGLEQVGVHRDRWEAALRRRQRPERRDGLRVPVDVELQPRLAGAVDQRQRRRSGLEPDLEPLRAAMRPRVHPRAAQLQQPVRGRSRERQPQPPAPHDRRRTELRRQPARHGVEHEPPRALVPRGRHPPEPAHRGRRKPLHHLGGGAQRRMALEDPADVGRGGVRAQRPPLLRVPVEAPSGDRAHGVDDLRAIGKREDHGLVAVTVTPQLDVVDGIRGAHHVHGSPHTRQMNGCGLRFCGSRGTISP